MRCGHGKWKTENAGRRKAHGVERYVMLNTRTYFRVRVKRINYTDGGRTDSERKTERNRTELATGSLFYDMLRGARVCTCMYECMCRVCVFTFFLLDRRTIAP